MAKIGIDFGTSYSVASYIDAQTGEAKPIRINGLEKIPTMLYFSSNSSTPLVGQVAYEKYDVCKDAESPEEMDDILSGIVTNIKRNMSKEGSIALPNGDILSYAQVVALFLAYIKKEAEKTCFGGQAVDAVCITYPVAFDAAPDKKDILREAATLAGFKEVKLLMEPVAAAKGFFGKKQCKNTGVLIYDFGGGTFDLAFVKFDNNGNHLTYSIDGDPNCGGENIDHAIYEAWDNIVFRRSHRHLSQYEGEVFLPILKTDCMKTKELMSNGAFNKRTLYLLPACASIERVPAFTQEEWDDIVNPWVDKTIAKVQQLLQKLQNDRNLGFQVDKVVLIGGSSRLPQVRKRLSEVCPVVLEQTQDVDVTVANGAAIFINESHEEYAERDVYCIYCGRKIKTSFRFCNACGRNNFRYDYRLRDN